MTARTYALYGFRVRSEIVLEAPPSAGDPDVDVRLAGRKRVGAEAGPGTVLAEIRLDEGQCIVSEAASGLVIRVPGAAEFRVAGRGPYEVDVDAEPGLDPGILALLIEGTLMSQLLTWAGETVLHGSAVEFDGSAVALLGGSGGGKSTLAAVLALGGGRLVTDDVLRVVSRGGRWRCAPGTGRLRLRERVEELAALFDPVRVSRDADGRATVTLEVPKADPRLAAVILPEPSRDATRPEARALGPAEALVTLGRFPRSLGWVDPRVRRSRFQVLAEMARTIPVVAVRVPWGPPFRDSLARELLEMAGLQGADRPAVGR